MIVVYTWAKLLGVLSGGQVGRDTGGRNTKISLHAASVVDRSPRELCYLVEEARVWVEVSATAQPPPLTPRAHDQLWYHHSCDLTLTNKASQIVQTVPLPS